MKKIFILTLIYLMSPSHSADVTIDCNYELLNPSPFTGTVANPPPIEVYTCTLQTAINSASAAYNTSGTHVDSRTDVGVQTFKKNRDVILPVLPSGLEAHFTALLGIYVEGEDFILLRNEDLAPFSFLIYLSVLNTGVSFLEAGLLNGMTNLEIVDFSGSRISYIDSTAFLKPSTTAGAEVNIKILRLNEMTECDEPVSATPLSGEFEVIADGADGITVFIDSLTTDLATNPCRTNDNLLNSLSTSILDSINQKSDAEQAQVDLSECQTELNDCKTAPTPETTTQPIPETTQPIPETTQPIPETTEPIPDTTTQGGDSACEAELQQALSDVANFKNSSEVCEAQKTELEEEITNLEELLTPVNGTCRFKETDDGYTCSANRVSIKSTPEQRVKWTGTHLASKANADVRSLLIWHQSTQFMPLDVGKTFTNLIAFTIEESGLSRLRRGDFVSLEKLEKVSLIDNQITAIDATTFDVLTALIELNLNGNQIANLPSRAFDKLRSLEHLDLSDNKITQLRYDLILSRNSISHFYARNNNLSKIDLIFVWRLSTADIVDFSGNTCDYKFDRSMLVESYTKDFFNSIVSECS